MIETNFILLVNDSEERKLHETSHQGCEASNLILKCGIIFWGNGTNIENVY